MKSRIVLPFAASLMLSASAALAQGAPPAGPDGRPMGHWAMNKEDWGKHRAEFCSDMTPRAVGKFAYLQAKLSLTDTQRPLFERWKSIVLSSIKAHEATCMSAKWPGQDASVADLAKLEQKRLEAHLADLKAQMPALEALTASLNAEQNKLFRREAMQMLHQRHEMMEHMRGMMGGMIRERVIRMRGGDGDMPPPPPAN